jgi:hypothetical protein
LSGWLSGWLSGGGRYTGARHDLRAVRVLARRG